MATLSKEEYLKRYLNPAESGDYKKKKKKRKEKVKKIRGMKIVDDDVSWSNIAPKEEEADLPDALLPMEEKPQIEVVDNRTEEEKALDAYRKSDKWKMVKKQNDVKGEPDSDNDLDDVPRRQKTRHDSSSDMDIPRRPRKNDGSESDNNEDRRRKNKRYDTDSDMDVPRRATKRHDSDSDIEVPRKSRKENKNIVKTKRHDSDSDLEVNRTRPSHQRHSSPGARNKEGKNSKRYHKSRHDSDSDLDLPRSKGQKEKSMKSRHDSSSDSDLDVPRSKSSSELKSHSRNDSTRKSRHDSDSDMEVPRRIEHSESTKSEKKQMSSGGAGGLTSRHELKKELEERKKRESDIDRLAKDSKKSATVFREKGGKKRDLEKERFEKKAEDKEKQKKKDKYEKWGKGVTQSSMKDYALEDLIHESNKPLARYRDDADLDALQRSRIRDGDPMAEYLSKKKSKESGNRPTMPKYRGPLPPPNRYHIQPGYRWDGVDRSNGFEKKFFTKQSERTAQKDEAYKWSVEDM